MKLLEFTDSGIYCPRAEVYLDPWKPVKKALITHGHSDHAYFGHEKYLCTHQTKPIIAHRLRLENNVQSLAYGEMITIQGVQFSFHPAGHIPGSAQIRIEYNGEVWVFSGDYKLQPDGISEPFEPVRCHVFITESTFGLPVYRWEHQTKIMEDINQWWRKNQQEGKVSVLAGYALGKAQRLLTNVDSSIGKIFVHGAVDVMNDVLRPDVNHLPHTYRVTPEMKKQEFEGSLIVCPPSAVGSSWMKKFLPYSLGIASGWMNLRGARRRRGADRGFALSDHADWNELNLAVRETGAQKVYVTHGYSDVFAAWLTENGIESEVIKTYYEGELAEVAESNASTETSNPLA